MDSFFNQIVYSAENEDPAAEMQALDIGEDDRVLCVTGSGSRPLSLLTESPGEIVAVDQNPRQTFLLELKVAAIRDLSHAEFLRFLGQSKDENRWETYLAIRQHLTIEARGFWDLERKKIEKGILYCGAWEKYLQMMSAYFRFRRRKLNQLLKVENLDAQLVFWKSEWNTLGWRLAIRLISIRAIWKYVIREPGIHFVPETFEIDSYLIDRFDQSAATRLFRENPFFHLLVSGRFSNHALPWHLHESNFPKLKTNLDRLRLETRPLQAYLEEHGNHFSAFSLSDFASYADPETYEKIWRSIVSSAVPGAKICERFFMVEYKPEKLFPGVIRRNRYLEDRLEREEYTHLYRFNCCEIEKKT